ncbi:leucine zipper domain-containing protein, partial [Clavibacter sepedonicus]
MELSSSTIARRPRCPIANARLTVHGRLLLVRRVVEDRRPVSHVARELGVSRQCAHRWVARFRQEGVAGLADRSSRPRSMPARTSPEQEGAVLAARAELRFGPARLAPVTSVPARTISRILRRHGAPPLAWLDPVTGAVIRASRSTAHRYEHEHPG